MGGKLQSTCRSLLCREEVKKRASNRLKRNGVALGDRLWVKPNGYSWWPAQVFDMDSMNRSSKTSKRSGRDVRVRLYGTNTYLYVDPVKCHCEFAELLKQNTANEIFHKVLEQEINRCKSGRPKRQGSTSKAKANLACKVESSKQNGVNKKKKIEASNMVTTPSGKSPESSTRRLRVMQSLGLISAYGVFAL